MRISDWSSDVCSSDLKTQDRRDHVESAIQRVGNTALRIPVRFTPARDDRGIEGAQCVAGIIIGKETAENGHGCRSEEHTSELQSLMRISYAVFCLKKKKNLIVHETSNYTVLCN